MNVGNTVFDVKRLIGRRFIDESVFVNMKYWSFKVVDDEGKSKVEVEYKGEIMRFILEEISLMVFVKMKKIVEIFLGECV